MQLGKGNDMKGSLVLRSLFASVLAGCLLALSVPHANAHDRYLWNLAAIGVDKKLHWESRGGSRGRNVKVGVIDSLVNCSHKELKGRCKEWTPNDGDYSTWIDHGTHVATTIAANDNSRGETGMVGVAPKAYIHSFGSAGGPPDEPTETKMINRARKIGVSVINMSYGPDEDADPDVPGQMVMGPNKFKNITSAKNRNIVFVQSAGNEENYYQNMEEPRDIYKKLKNLIIVVAVDHNKEIADYSNFPAGACFDYPACKRKNLMMYFTVAAPGTHIEAGYPNGGYGINDGTSMAAPHVTGVVALLHSHWPVLKKRAGATTNIIFHTAQDLGTKGVDVLYGWGLVRADRALSPLGKKYLKKNNKIYPVAKSSLRVSPALAALTRESVTFFDEYDRDFQIPLATFAPGYHGTLGAWVRTDNSYHEYTSVSDSGLSYGFSANGYDPADSSLADIQFRLSYQEEQGRAWHFGQGQGIDRLEAPGSLTFGLMAGKTALAGAYPVLSIADGGAFGILNQPIGDGYELTGGVLSNTTPYTEDEDRNYAPEAEALVVSLGKRSLDQKLFGHITATYLVEEDGVLGTGGSGGLNFTEGFDSNSVTLGARYRLNRDYAVSASYTEAFSRGNNGTDSLLSLESTRLSSSAFALGLEKQTLMADTDRLKFSVSQPLRIDKGLMSLTHGDYYDEDEVLHSRVVDIDLAPTGRQIDFQLQYTVSPKENLDFGLFAYYADDYLHQSDLNNYGAGIRFTGMF